jgi:hypothetical protein
MKLRAFLAVVLPAFLFWTAQSRACTTAVISGKYTVDGRPLLLKHRDTGHLQNKLVYFTDGKYAYIGLVNADDSLAAKVWAGVNSAGFAIMNSASYNLNTGDTTKIKDREGYLMKRALQVCATLADFERLLDTLAKPLGVEANFGVIDAQGGAAYYETSNWSYTKFDANDPRTAPFGYIIRTNYSYTGERENDKGIIRYQTAAELFYRAAQTSNLSYRFLLQDVSRCLYHSLTGTDLAENLPSVKDNPLFVPFRDYIPRYFSASTVVIQGVKKGESPDLATMWTVLGFPLTSVAIPVWVAGGDMLPSILKADYPQNAPLCSAALNLKSRCFPMKRGNGKYYLNWPALLNREGEGILQKLRPVENAVLEKAEAYLSRWRNRGIRKDEIRAFYTAVEKSVRNSYRQLFGIEMR